MGSLSARITTAAFWEISIRCPLAKGTELPPPHPRSGLRGQKKTRPAPRFPPATQVTLSKVRHLSSDHCAIYSLSRTISCSLRTRLESSGTRALPWCAALHHSGLQRRATGATLIDFPTPDGLLTNRYLPVLKIKVRLPKDWISQVRKASLQMRKGFSSFS